MMDNLDSSVSISSIGLDVLQDIISLRGDIFDTSSLNSFNRVYHPNGQLSATGYIDANGNADGVITGYYENGCLKYEVTYVAGELRGIAKGYYENGTLKFEGNFMQGEYFGVWKEFHTNGSLATVIHRRASFEQVIEEYYENGFLKAEIQYRDDCKMGVEKEYYENGNLKCEVRYHNGSKQGPAKWYRESGEVIVEITYQNDKAVSGRCCKDNRQLTGAHLHRMDKEGVVESGICS